MWELLKLMDLHQLMIYPIMAILFSYTINASITYNIIMVKAFVYFECKRDYREFYLFGYSTEKERCCGLKKFQQCEML